MRVILLVDDSGEDLAIALRALRRANLPIEVRTARDGGEALKALHVNGKPPARDVRLPEVIFLDVHMPRIDGFEVLKALRNAPHTRSIPVVMVSTSSWPEDARRAYELGANSYLVKRFDGQDPGAFIAEAARYWFELNFSPKAG
jgi:two-component system, response regulator